MSGPWEKYSSTQTPGKPWESYASAKPGHIKENVQAGVEGFGQGVAAGYLPQLQAGAEKAMDFIADSPASVTPIGLLARMAGAGKSDTDKQLEAQGFTIQGPDDSYVAARDRNIARHAKYAEEMPRSYYGGQVAGAISSAPMYGKALTQLPGLAKPAQGLMGRTTQAAAGGAVLGAVQNPGDEQGVIDPVQLEARKKNAKTGAVLGGLTQVGTEGIRKGATALKNLPGRLKESSQFSAFKSSGAMLKDFRRAFGKGRVAEVGQEMIDSGLTKPGMTFDDVAAKSKELVTTVGDKIGKIYDKVNANFTIQVNPQKFAGELLDAALDPKIRPTVGVDKYDDAMIGVVKDLIKDPNKLGDVRYVNDLIGELDTLINHSKRAGDLPAVQQGYLQMRRFLRERLNGLVETTGNMLGDPSLKKELIKLNRRYGNLREINSMASDRVAREGANRMFTLGDRITGMGGAVIGSGGDTSPEGLLKAGLIGAGAGMAARGARLYGRPVAATAANKVGGLISNLPSPVTGTVEKVTGLLAKDPAGLGSAGARIFNQPKQLGVSVADDRKGKKRVASK